MPASPVALPNPLPKITAQLPLCRRRICGVPKVLPRFWPQLGAFAHVIDAEFHSPMTRGEGPEALPSAKLLGSEISSAKIACPPAPRPLTNQVCQALP